MNNNWHKKEKPLLGLTGLGGGVDGLAVVGGAVKTYIDEVFSTNTWIGDADNSRVITTNIDQSGEGCLTWVKCRSNAEGHVLVDTVRGATKILMTDSSSSWQGNVDVMTEFTSSGYKPGSHDNSNGSGKTYVGWTFRKAPGFFDIVSYTGNSTSYRAISHNLGCVPGFVVVKRVDGGSGDWKCLHSYDFDKYLELNQTQAAADSFGDFNNTHPTSTTFTVSNDAAVNKTGDEYIAYVFARGDTGLRNSVDFDGSDYLSYADDDAWKLGTGDWTMECFWKSGSGNSGNYQQLFGTQTVWAANDGIWRIGTRTTSNQIYFSRADGSGFEEPVWDVTVNDESWHHLAFTRNSGNVYCWVDGVQQTNVGESNNITGTMTTSNAFRIAHNARDGTYNTGKISNLRIVKGTAVYSNGSNFTTPTEPLSSISGTVFLGCDASTLGSASLSTKKPTITGDPTVSTDNPFTTAAAGAVFGSSGDKDIIRMGSYQGNASASGPEINLGWEPQWILIKEASTGGQPWSIFDSMRGIVTDGGDNYIHPNETSQETANLERVDLTSTGFKITDSGWINNSGETYIWMAIRRPDGYVGKPPSAGTDVFTMVYGNSSSSIPNFPANFPVDMGIYKEPTNSYDWYTHTRLTGGKSLKTNSNAVQSAGTDADATFDSNAGWGKFGYNTDKASWLWKRHAGFTVCTWEGDGVIGRQIAHDMNKTPEMIWLKRRTGSARNWPAYHKGLNGGSSPENYVMWLNLTNAESEAVEAWNDTAPTSTHFTIHGTVNEPNTNTDGEDYIAMLFASVAGISKLGSFSGSSSSQTITTGFAPRFIMIKARAGVSGYGWFIWDSVRYSGSNNLKLTLNTDGAQDSASLYQYFNDAPISGNSTGFTLVSDGWGDTTGFDFVYYAHA